MIGYVSLQSDSPEMAVCLAKLGSAYHVPIALIRFSDLLEHFFGSELSASIWNGRCFEECHIPLPSIIDTSGKHFSKKNEPLYAPGFITWLQSNAMVMEQASLNKRWLAQSLMGSNLSLYAIPTWSVSSYNELLNQLKLVKNALIKPNGGRMGMGVIKVKKKGNGEYILYNSCGETPLTMESFQSYLDNNSASQLGNTVLVQPCLDFSFDDRHAVDFRLLRHRGFDGKWQVVDTYARIGASNLVSNVSQGGFIADAKETLTMIAGDKADVLYDEILQIGDELPQHIQQQLGENVYCLGIDIAVDRESLCPFIIEANTYPGTRFHTYKLAEKRVQFYMYLLSQMQKPYFK